MISAKIKFRWKVPEVDLHRNEAVGLNSWLSWIWTTENINFRFKTSILGSMSANVWLQCNWGAGFSTCSKCKAWQEWLEPESAVYFIVQCIIMPINCKTGVVHVHSEVGSANHQVHCVVHLDWHWCTWTCSSTHSSVYTDRWCTQCVDVGAMETVLESLESLCICLHTLVMDMTCWWYPGAMQRKAKIDKRVGLARPRV